RTMDLDREPLPDGFGFRYQDAEPRIDPRGWRMQKGIEHHIAAVHGILANARPAQNEGTSLPRFALFHGPVLGVDGPHARFKAGWAHHNTGASADGAREYGASDGCAVTSQGEAPVHGKAEPAFARPASPIVERCID